MVSLGQIDLNLLLVLHTVLSEGSVVRAARRLHVTPSGVSNSLARLRDVFGDPLLARSGRGLVPTPRALELAPLLAQALKQLDTLVASGAAFDPRATTREFTLAIADSGLLVRVPGLAQRLGEQMPRAKLRVVGIDTLLSSGGLAGTVVDVAIAALPEPIPGVRTEVLAIEQTVLAASSTHPLGARKLTVNQLAELRHVDVEVAPGRGYRELAASYAELGIERQVALIVPAFTAAAEIVARTRLVATLPATLVKLVGARMGLRALRVPVRSLSAELQLAWHERTEHDPALRLFRDLIRSTVG